MSNWFLAGTGGVAPLIVLEQNASNRNSGVKTTGNTSVNIPITVDAGSNKILIISTSGDGAPVTLIRNGDAMTMFATLTQTRTVELWYLLDPDVGTFNLTMVAGSSPDITFGGTTYINVDQGSPFLGFESDFTNGTSVTISDTVATTDMFIGAVTIDINSHTPNVSQTEIWTGIAFGITGSLSQRQGLGGSTSIGYTFPFTASALIGTTLVLVGTAPVPTEIEEQPSGNRVSGEKEFGFTSDTESFTTDSGGAKRLLIVCTAGNGVATSVTYNGVSLSNQVGHDDGFFGCDIWYLVNPPTGSHNIVVFGGSTVELAWGATAFWYVDQSTPMTNNVVDDDFGTSHSLSINPVATDDRLLMTSICENATTPTGGGTQIDWLNFGGAAGVIDGNHKIGTGGNTSCSYSHLNSFFVQVATKINFEVP